MARVIGEAYVTVLPEVPVPSVPVVHRKDCYICEDPEFAAMGLPLCRKCPSCIAAGRGDGHIPADDEACDDCGWVPWTQVYGPPGGHG